MADARRRRPAAQARTADRVVAPAQPHPLSLPCVVGGLLRGQPELSLLAAAALGLATLELVDDRFALLSTIAASKPGVLVVPPFDADRTSTVPLILRVRREAPAVAVLVVSSHPAGAGQPMLRALQAGAHVITSPTPNELHTVLGTLLESRVKS
jgi:hypothetical protein